VTIFELDDRRTTQRIRLAATRAVRLREVRERFRAAHWQAAYRRRIFLTDAVVVVVTALVADLARVSFLERHSVFPDVADRVLVVAALVAGWMLALGLGRSYDARVYGSGPLEYQRVFGASWKFFSALVVLALLLQGMGLGLRPLLLVGFAVGVVGLLLGRWFWRTLLHRERSKGGCTTAVLAIGLREQAERLIRQMNERPDSGYRVVGVCVPTGDIRPGEEILGVPVLGDLRTAGTIATQVKADCVAVSGSDAITADVVRRLGWELEPFGVDLMLTAELADVAGPRIMITPEQSVSLLHVDAPRFAGPKYVVKTIIDWTGAAVLTVVTLPVLVVVGLAVGLTSPGGTFYTQHRVGRGGRTFPMIKFRTMRPGADRDAHVLTAENDGNGVLFKRRDDPRVTPVGRVLRRYSLDELPQLFNVLAGQMSLVGPRPPLPHEVSKYEARMRRRLLVKPGLTGLWQVGGRSDLSWEESVRLDVYYAENWTPFGDLLIIAKTAKAVLTGRGAY
jgi:exopolysaccharide biosynthesis polyprenyl glycosylphosphotransferase